MARESFGLTDRDWLYLSGVIVVLVVLWWFWRKANQPTPAETPAEASGALPVGWETPMTGVYDANPDAYQPPGNANLTLNVNANQPNILNEAFMPLFGFVGIAQGETFQ